MSPDEYCQEKAAQSGSSFYYSFLFLPPEKRRAITALYAYCREVDDVVDECSDADLARAKLAWWRQEIAGTFAGAAQHPVAKALIPVVRQFDLPQARFHEIIDGMAMDLQYNRYPDFATLQSYCYRVAGVVGLMAAQISATAIPQRCATQKISALRFSSPTSSATSVKMRAAIAFICRWTNWRASVSLHPRSFTCVRRNPSGG